jgi:hypothetical protein
MGDQHTPPAGRLPPYLLAAAYTLTCLAYAWRFNRFSCKTFSFLWEENGMSEAFAGRVEGVMILLLLVAAGSIWIRKIRGIALLGIIPMLFEMGSETFMPSAKYPLLYWAEWALRYTTPIGAILLFNPTEKKRLWGIRLLQISIALVFAAHGMKALLADPAFIDYLLVFFRRIGVGAVSEERVLTLVHFIGTLDLVLAAHLLFLKLERNRAVLIWMAVWGAITAFSRMSYGGWGNGHEVLIRTTHCMGPLVLWLLIRTQPSEEAE